MPDDERDDETLDDGNREPTTLPDGRPFHAPRWRSVPTPEERDEEVETRWGHR